MKPKIIKKQVLSKVDKPKVMTFRYSKVQDVNFTFTTLPSSEFPLNEDDLGFSINWQCGSDPKNNLLKLKLTVSYKYKAKDGNNVSIIVYTNINEFFIANFNEIVTYPNDSKVFSISETFMMNLISVSIATARGILISKLSSTKYSSFVLPVVPSRIIKEIYESGIKGKKKIN